MEPKQFQEILLRMAREDSQSDLIWSSTPGLARANVLARDPKTRSEGMATLLAVANQFPNSSNVCALVAQALAWDGRQDEAIAFIRDRFPQYLPAEQRQGISPIQCPKCGIWNEFPKWHYCMRCGTELVINPTPTTQARRTMTERTIEVEADTLEEARERARSRMPEGFQWLSEQIISDGAPRAVTAVADTTEAAYAKARDELPSDTDILEKRELTAPAREIVTIEEFEEQYAWIHARGQASRRFGATATVKSVKLVAAGRKGFLGVGVRPNQYEAELLRQAVVEVTYKPKAKIAWAVTDSSSTAFPERSFGNRTPSVEGKASGDKIVFRTGDSVWLLDIQRDELPTSCPPRRVVEKPSHQVTGMCASPDRQTIAYDLIEGAWGGDRGSYTIEIIQVSSGQVTSLRPFVPPLRETGRGRVEFNFAGGAFSPDGNLLAFPGSFGLESAGAALSNPKIAIMDLRGKPRIIADIAKPFETLGCYYPCFLSQTQLVHVANFAYEDLLEVCIADISKSGFDIQTRRLTTKADIVWNKPYCFAVAERRAFFVRGHNRFTKQQICYVSPDEGLSATIHPIGTTYEEITDLQIHNPSASVIYVAEHQIWVCDFNGHGIRPLLKDEGIGCADGVVSSSLSLSSDGKKVVFVADNKKDIYIAEIDTGTAAKLVSIEIGKPSNPIWL